VPARRDDPTLAPLRWISALVPTVVPWSAPRYRRRTVEGNAEALGGDPHRGEHASAKSRGVEKLGGGDAPGPSSATQSVKVPPMSTPTRSRATCVVSAG